MENNELLEQEHESGMFVTPLGDFDYQSFPIFEDKKYFITDEELEKLGKHELKWVYDEENRPMLVENDNTSEKRITYITSRMAELKQLLAETDYRAIKYSEGIYTAKEYAPYKEQREAWRKEINDLEVELEEINK